MSIFTRMFRRGPRDPDDGPEAGADGASAEAPRDDAADAAAAARARARAAAAAAAAASAAPLVEDQDADAEPDTDPGLSPMAGPDLVADEPPDSGRATERLERIDPAMFDVGNHSPPQADSRITRPRGSGAVGLNDTTLVFRKPTPRESEPVRRSSRSYALPPGVVAPEPIPRELSRPAASSGRPNLPGMPHARAGSSGAANAPTANVSTANASSLAPPVSSAPAPSDHAAQDAASESGSNGQTRRTATLTGMARLTREPAAGAGADASAMAAPPAAPSSTAPAAGHPPSTVPADVAASASPAEDPRPSAPAERPPTARTQTPPREASRPRPPLPRPTPPARKPLEPSRRTAEKPPAAPASSEPPVPAKHVDRVTTAEDRAELRALFSELAGHHMVQLRDFMIEVRCGSALAEWIALSEPAVRSVRGMAEQLELGDICAALDSLLVALADAHRSGGQISGEHQLALLAAYVPLTDLLPGVLELDAERDRREPIIVHSLLRQIPGIEKMAIDKLVAANLVKVGALAEASGEELAQVTGLSLELAERVVTHFREYRSKHGAVASPDARTELRALATLLERLRQQNSEYDVAAGSWAPGVKERKRELRRERAATLLAIHVSLARLGEVDRLVELDRLNHRRKVEFIENTLQAARAAARARTGGGPA
jgi:hypothetical protein